MRARALASALVSIFALSACQRGCAKSWLAERGVGGDPRTSPSAIVPLNAVDCPDGLARCRDGVVEASKLATIPHPCAGSIESCACPWERVADCPRGCTSDGLELVVERAHAATQLCAPSAADAFARPAPSTAPPAAACIEAEYRCASRVIVACANDGGAPRAVAECVRGCAEEGSSVDDPVVGADQAVALLCAHR